MASSLLLVLSALTALAGCAFLALSQTKHVTRVFGSNARPPFGRATPALGIVLLCMALIPCMFAESRGIAVLYWIMTVTSSAIVVVGLLAFRPSWLKIVKRFHPANWQHEE